MTFPTQRLHKKYVTLLGVYVFILVCNAIVFRTPTGKDNLITDWFWGYHSDQRIIFWDNVFNIVAFVPIGVLIGLIVPRYKVMLAVLAGLFISETIECSQLIWKRGAFDVDDLFSDR